MKGDLHIRQSAKEGHYTSYTQTCRKVFDLGNDRRNKSTLAQRTWAYHLYTSPNWNSKEGDRQPCWASGLAVISLLTMDPNKAMQETVTVIVAQGALRRREETSKCQQTYFSFRGIPYANPPVGALRFKVRAFGPVGDLRVNRLLKANGRWTFFSVKTFYFGLMMEKCDYTIYI